MPDPYGWFDVDEANKKDGHYHRFNALKPLALRSAELALERANNDLALVEKLYDRGLATADDVIVAVEARALVFNLRSLLLDFWFIEMQAKAAELDAFRHGEISYRLGADGWQPHELARSADVTVE